MEAANSGKRNALRGPLFALAALLLAGGFAGAQAPQPAADDTKARIEQLEAEIRALKGLLQQPAAPGQTTAPAQPAAPDPNAVTKIVEQGF